MSEDAFIRYLTALNHENNGTLARYRRACGERWPGPCPELGQFGEPGRKLAIDFLTLSLATQYKSETIKKSGLPSSHRSGKRSKWPFKGEGNFGTAWAAYCRIKEKQKDPHTFYKNRQKALAAGHATENIPSIHERFRRLLDAEIELDGTGELAQRLRGMVRMLVSADIPLDVIQLAHDLRRWRAESRYIQERWARAFYAPPKTQDMNQEYDSGENSEDNQAAESNDEENLSNVG